MTDQTNTTATEQAGSATEQTTEQVADTQANSATDTGSEMQPEIGRASCRERV